jgi:hypothetical protein
MAGLLVHNQVAATLVASRQSAATPSQATAGYEVVQLPFAGHEQASVGHKVAVLASNGYEMDRRALSDQENADGQKTMEEKTGKVLATASPASPILTT